MMMKRLRVRMRGLLRRLIIGIGTRARGIRVRTGFMFKVGLDCDDVFIAISDCSVFWYMGLANLFTTPLHVKPGEAARR